MYVLVVVTNKYLACRLNSLHVLYGWLTLLMNLNRTAIQIENLSFLLVRYFKTIPVTVLVVVVLYNMACVIYSLIVRFFDDSIYYDILDSL